MFHFTAAIAVETVIYVKCQYLVSAQDASPYLQRTGMIERCIHKAVMW